MPFSSIRDDGVSRLGGETLFYKNPEDYYASHDQLENYYRISLHADQPAAVSVLCEAAGMVPMVARAANSYRVAVASSSGFDSLTVKYDLFTTAWEKWQEFGQRTTLLHLGDHDPSGVSVFESMQLDLSTFCEDQGEAGLIEMRRVALTPEQIAGLGVEPQPDAVKPTDSRSKSFLERDLDPAAQLEAIPPDTLIDLVRGSVEDALDLDLLRASVRREARERDKVQTKLDVVNEALRDAFVLED